MLVFWFFDEDEKRGPEKEQKIKSRFKYEVDYLPEIGEKFIARNIEDGETKEMTCFRYRKGHIWGEYEIPNAPNGINFVNVIGWEGEKEKKKPREKNDKKKDKKKVIAVYQIEQEYQEAIERGEKLLKEIKKWREERAKKGE